MDPFELSRRSFLGSLAASGAQLTLAQTPQDGWLQEGLPVTNLYSLPRELRESPPIASDGMQTVFGPFAFRIFDEEDVAVYLRRPDTLVETSLSGFIVTRTETGAFSSFTITFAVPPPAGILSVRGERIAERSTNVTRGGTLDSRAIELEFSKQAVVQQELRRDLSAARATLLLAEQRLAALDRHTHTFELPLADEAMVAAGIRNDVLVTPGVLRPSLDALENLIVTRPIIDVSAIAPTVAALTLADVSPGVGAVYVQGYRTPGIGAALYRRVGSNPAHLGKIQSRDGAWWEIAEDYVSPEMLGLPADGTGDATAVAGVATLLQRPIRLSRSGTYVFRDLALGPRTILQANGGRIVRGSGARHAIVSNTAFARVNGAFFDQDIFLADGSVDPNKAAVSAVVSSTSRALTLRAGDGSRFKTGMVLFVETAHAKGVAEARHVTAVTGDVVTLHRPLDGAAVVGGAVVADYPLVATGRYSFADILSECVFRNFVVGVQTGSIDGPVTGNAAPLAADNHFERFVGAAIVQTIGVAAENISGFRIIGEHTLTATYTAAPGQSRFGYRHNPTPYMHRFDEPSIRAIVNGVAVTASVDTAAKQVVLGSACVGGDTVIVHNSEWAARGFLCDGQGGSVNGMGLLSGGVILACAIIADIVGGTPATDDGDGSSAGDEYLRMSGCVFDTASYAVLRVDGTRGVIVSSCSLWFAPYPILIRAGNRGFYAADFSTSLMPASSIHNPADRPARAEITVEDGATDTHIDLASWNSVSGGYVLGAGTIGKVRWAPPATYKESGSLLAPSDAFREEPGLGFYRPSAGRIAAAVEGSFAGAFAKQGFLAPSGSAAAPGVAFNSDPASGVWSPQAGRLEFVTSGTRRLLLTEDGRLVFGNNFSLQWGNGVVELSGSGSPEGVITAVKGSTFRRLDGGAGSCFYVKESGAGNTGWVAK